MLGKNKFDAKSSNFKLQMKFSTGFYVLKFYTTFRVLYNKLQLFYFQYLQTGFLLFPTRINFLGKTSHLQGILPPSTKAPRVP